MKNIISYPYQKGYGLRLSDGNNWWITSDEKNIHILEKFAFIMNLREIPSDNMPKYILSSPINEDALYKSDNDWQVSNYRAVRIWHNKSYNNAICEINNDQGDFSEYYIMWTSLQFIYKTSFHLGGLPFHAGLAEYNGHGIIFAGVTGMGKSTCCRRLEGDWKALSDDEMLVVLDENKNYVAHPFPTWSEYLVNKAENSWDVQRSVPLSSIFFIERAEKDEIIPISDYEGCTRIIRSTTQVLESRRTDMTNEEKPQLLKHIFNNAFNMSKAIPTFRLCLSLNGRFWEEIEKTLKL